MKGVPQILLGDCTKFIDKNGNVSNINPQYIKLINQTIANFTQSGLRIILLAYK